jgi:hypothetical protein
MDHSENRRIVDQRKLSEPSENRFASNLLDGPKACMRVRPTMIYECESVIQCVRGHTSEEFAPLNNRRSGTNRAVERLIEVS